MYPQLILAMGNYMNQGNQRVGEAAGFKIKVGNLALRSASDILMQTSAQS